MHQQIKKKNSPKFRAALLHWCEQPDIPELFFFLTIHLLDIPCPHHLTTVAYLYSVVKGNLKDGSPRPSAGIVALFLCARLHAFYKRGCDTCLHCTSQDFQFHPSKGCCVFAFSTSPSPCSQTFSVGAYIRCSLGCLCCVYWQNPSQIVKYRLSITYLKSFGPEYFRFQSI